MLASTFMDLVLGVDIHFEMVPMPAPVPTPIPNPFVGMVFDPAGLLVGQALSVTMALVSGKPPLGPVLINSMPATTVGTNAINSLGVPHILIPPGTAWAPMPKLPKPSFKGKPPAPGPPVAPEGDAISVFGSQTVNVMGTSAVRMGDKSMSCGEPVRLPSSTVLAIPKGMPVMIGGPPAISIMGSRVWPHKPAPRGGATGLATASPVELSRIDLAVRFIRRRTERSTFTFHSTGFRMSGRLCGKERRDSRPGISRTPS